MYIYIYIVNMFLTILLHLRGKFKPKYLKQITNQIRKLEGFLKDWKKHPELTITQKAPVQSETHWEAIQTSKMEPFAKIIDCIRPLTIFVKHSMLHVSQSYEYALDRTKQKPGALRCI